METDACQQIYASLEQRCPPLDLSETWQRMPPHPAFRLWTPDAIDALRVEFAEHDLIAAGILQSDSQAGPVLADHLRSEQPILPLRKAADQPPAQLVVGHQVWPHRADACLAILRDDRLQQLAKTSQGHTFAASSLCEMAVMWACGLATTLGAGMETLSIRGLRWLEERVAHLASLAERPADENDEDDSDGAAGDLAGEDADDDGFDSRGYPASLTFVDWSPVEMMTAQQPWIGPIWRHLAAAERHCSDLSLRQKIWSPPAESLERVAFCLLHGEASDIARAMTDSSRYDLRSLADATTGSAQDLEPPSYPDAYAQWQKSLNSYHGAEYTHRRWEELLAAIERQYIGPLLERSMSLSDPVKRNCLLLLAQVLRQLHLCWLRADQQPRNGAQGTTLIAPARAEELRNLLALQNSALQLTKDLHACARKTPKPRWQRFRTWN